MKFKQTAMTQFKKPFTLMLLLIGTLMPLTAYADKNNDIDKSKLEIIGRVKDATFRKDLVKAKVYLTDSLGAVIDSTQTGGWIYGDGHNYFELAKFSFRVPRQAANYTIEVRMPDYQDTFYSLQIDKIGRREFSRDIPDIYMQEAARQLKEVVVTTSKVKFYNKGDTIVFNADAFELAEGSMLDALIKQLPGVELKEGGQIYVNGEFVENLLLNGKDFFKGKNELMLDNLGAYTVKNVEVYKRSSDLEEWAGDKGKQELVMDVKLKKEYNSGWIMNFEAGIGTSDRYMGRAFINRFTANSRLSVIGNLNNLNDNRKPGESSTWTPETNTTGTMITQLGGIDYYVQEADEKWKVTGDATVRHSSQKDYRETSRLNFLGANRTYDYDYMTNKTRSLFLATSHRVTLKPNKKIYLGASASGSYSRTRSDLSDIGGAFNDEQPNMTSEILEALYSGNPEELKDVINRTKIKTKNSGYAANGGVSASGGWSVPGTSDYLYYGANFNFQSNKSEVWRDYIVNYGTDPNPALRQNRYFDNSPNRSYKAEGTISYQYTFSEDTRLTMGYSYSHSDSKQDSYAYALDRLEEQGVFGTLPEGYLATMDASQSYRSHTIENTHSPELQFSYWTNKCSIYLNPSVRIVNRNFDYFRNNTDHHVDQHAVLVTVPEFYGRVQFSLSPSEQNGRKYYRHRLTFLPGITSTLADPVKMIDIVDSNDPMNIWTGNRDLKPSYKYKGYIQWLLTVPIKNYTFNNFMEVVYSYTHNQLVNGYRYDTSTGVRTHKTYNVPSGNTSTNIHVQPSLQFGNKGQFTASLFGGVDFIESSDMIGINADPVKSQVHTVWSVEKLNFAWQIGKQSLSLR
ncbi:MAG: outer membrane beta-barrel family protein, partial [Muribaculaceae bacterium]|nr:outer membrane beta-barrel family protein [Muribaculaceae bacterium]